MKEELSIEQKARNYDEALERARKEYKDHEAFNSFRNMLVRIFPELRESEDEKILKELISIVKAYRENCITEGNHRFDNCLAWLEKQGNTENCLTELKDDKSEEIRKLLIRLFISNNPNEKFDNISTHEIVTWLEDQGKQKQKQYDIDILEKHITKDSISELAHTVMVRNGWEIVDAKEQKLTGWSEWDDKMVKIIDTLLMRASAGTGLGTIRCPYDDARDFIQSLKQRYGWKPSKEQIIALRWVLNNIPYNKHKEEISGLLDQIKNYKI